MTDRYVDLVNGVEVPMSAVDIAARQAAVAAAVPLTLATHLSPADVTAIVKTLVAKGVIAVTDLPADAQSVVANPTKS